MAPLAILSVKYLAAPSAASALRAVGGFVRYIQYRDHHHNLGQSTSRMLRYVGYRDRTTTQGQLFNATGRAGDLERKALVSHVRRSLRDIAPGTRPQRAVYRLVLSPAKARGLDLRQLARATMRGLERDTGPLPPWVAAVHRNTQHPHVHIVMAARREVSPDCFRTVLITRPRLVRMKESLGLEMSKQMGQSIDNQRRSRDWLGDLVRVERTIDSRPPLLRPRKQTRSQRVAELGSGLRRAARNYRREMEHQLEEEFRRSREWGWER
jgi:hypothetical protein